MLRIDRSDRFHEPRIFLSVEGGDIEIDRSVGVITVAIFDDSLNESDYGGNVVRNASHECGRDHIEMTHIGEKSAR